MTRWCLGDDEHELRIVKTDQAQSLSYISSLRISFAKTRHLRLLENHKMRHNHTSLTVLQELADILYSVLSPVICLLSQRKYKLLRCCFYTRRPDRPSSFSWDFLPTVHALEAFQVSYLTQFHTVFWISQPALVACSPPRSV